MVAEAAVVGADGEFGFLSGFCGWFLRLDSGVVLGLEVGFVLVGGWLLLLFWMVGVVVVGGGGGHLCCFFLSCLLASLLVDLLDVGSEVC